MSAVVGTVFVRTVPLGVSGLTFTRNDQAIVGVTTNFNPMMPVPEIGSTGIYQLIYTPSAAGPHSWAATASDGQMVTWDFYVITAQQADPVTAVGLTSARVARLDRIGSGTAVATSPVGADATTLRIDRGDDYTGDNPIPFSEPSTGWPDLSDAQSVALLLLNRVNVAVLTVTGSVVNATPGAQTIAFELTESQTGALNLGPHAYQFRVKAVLADGADRTLALGDVEVRA